MYIFDVETDGLLPEATKIHCLVAIDTDTQLVHKAVGHEEVAALFKEMTNRSERSAIFKRGAFHVPKRICMHASK